MGHDEIARLTREDVVRFKDHRVSTPSRRTGLKVCGDSVRRSGWTENSVWLGGQQRPHRQQSGREGHHQAGKKRRLRSPGFSDGELLRS